MLKRFNYNDWKNEGEITKEILQKTLKFNYTDIYKVNLISNACNELWAMEDGEVKQVGNEDLYVICKMTLDGYDNEVKKYVLD